MNNITNAQTFTDALYAMALSVLPYIGGAVAGGLVVFAMTWGVRSGVRMLRTAGDGGYEERDGHLFYNGQDLGDPYEYGTEAYDRDRADDDFYDKGH